MRKRNKSRLNGAAVRAAVPEDWLDVAAIAEVEFTSESPDFPVESMFESGTGGWRAESPGPQTIRLIFDTAQSIRQIRLRFSETVRPRTQEFVLSWAADLNAPVREIVRQQWNFSPDGSTEEVENYAVALEKVAVLRLDVNPDVSRSDAVASIAGWRIR